MKEMADIFVYPEDFIFLEDRSVTTEDRTPVDMSSSVPLHHEILLSEEPPLVPPSVFGDDSEAAVQFRSSFLFQSSCYLPDVDSDSDSDCTPTGAKEPPKRHEISPVKPSPLPGSADNTGSSSTDDNVIDLIKRFEPSTKKRTWKVPRHHHIEFRNDVSVSDTTRKVDPSYRGYRIYVPGQANSTRRENIGDVDDDDDEFTVTEALTRAGMSTLSNEVADFLAFVMPTTKKHQWTCATICVVAIAIAAIVGVTCGLGYCEVDRGTESYRGQLVDADPSGAIPDSVPTAAPSLRVVAASSSKPFLSIDELYVAVDEYLVDGSHTSNVALEYGHPIGTWDVGALTSFSNVFDIRRNPLVIVFNEDLNDWDTSSATTMEGMFYGAQAFNGNISSWTTSSVINMREVFAGAEAFNSDISRWDVSSVETTEGMFDSAHSFSGNLWGWQTSSLTNMDSMFMNCFGFEGRGLEGWDTSNVKSMRHTFTNTPKFKGDLSAWNVSQVTTMKGLFRQAVSVNSDISHWDLSSATDLSEMFMHAVTFNSEVAKWNTSLVTDMSFMFFGAASFNIDISSWNVRNVANFTKMLASAAQFDHDLCNWGRRLPKHDMVVTTSMFLSTSCPNKFDPDANNWTYSSFCHYCDPSTDEKGPFTGSDDFVLPTEAVTFTLNPTASPNNMFNRPTDPTQHRLPFFDRDELQNAVDKYLVDSTSTSHVAEIYGYPIGSWDVSLVMDFSSIFDALRNPLTSTFDDDLSGWNTSCAQAMDRTFAGASSFTGDISNWSTGRVKSMQAMFAGADLFDGDLSSWDTSEVSNMESMFRSALSFTGIGLSYWDTGSVTTMKSMFEEAGSFQADLSSWDVGNVVDMSEIFYFASAFNSDLSEWNVSNVELFSYAFSGASSFNRDLSSWEVRSAVSVEGMFTGAKNFNQNLCSWGPLLLDNLVVSGMFVASGCLTTQCPDANNHEAGPLCHYCTS